MLIGNMITIIAQALAAQAHSVHQVQLAFLVNIMQINALRTLIFTIVGVRTPNCARAKMAPRY